MERLAFYLTSKYASSLYVIRSSWGVRITRDALVDFADAVIARYLGNSWNSSSVNLACWGIFVKRDVAAPTYERARKLA